MNKPIIPANLTDQLSDSKTASITSTWRRFFKTKRSANMVINRFKAAKYIYPITITIIIVILIWFMSFLYDNVYTTMSQAAELSSLKSKVIEERLNLKELDQAIQRINAKKSLLNWNDSSKIITPFLIGNKKPTKSTSTPATSTPAIKTTSTPTSTPQKI